MLARLRSGLLLPSRKSCNTQVKNVQCTTVVSLPACLAFVSETVQQLKWEPTFGSIVDSWLQESPPNYLSSQELLLEKTIASLFYANRSWGRGHFHQDYGTGLTLDPY